jgi:galactofuranosylgalactofuranosylrhamnosyl-N-acetylglucosaminyl-diphospho-decaprenol beta-1,5/1,6-galactofuranosyltransferase
MADRVIQRLVFPDERPLDSLYYRVHQPSGRGFLDFPAPSRFSITLRRGSTLDTDTYFNSFFENYWRRFTHVRRLRLRLELTGAGSVLLFRRSLVTGFTLLERVEFDTGRPDVVLDIPEPNFHFRELGALHFRVHARSAEVRLRKADWVASDVMPEPVRLVAGYCTFNRETFLLNNVRTLVDDDDVADVLAKIVVVDQGTAKIRNHPAFAELGAIAKSKLWLVEQDNYGGSGGFTRSILEARSVPMATHVLLMDDDAIIEAESVFRAAAFLSLAREEIALGSPMLDLLRPVELYESGGSVVPHRLGVTTDVYRVPVHIPENLAPFLKIAYNHYNAWWFFAFPLRLVDRVGLPLPMFIRGDDVEFGCRLQRAGIPTVTVPGLGVWHEPFYLKVGSWQPYYDMRNILALTAVHFPLGRLHVVKTLLSRLVKLVLALNYSEAAIMCEAVDDFCAGPKILEADPITVHRKILELKKTLEPASVSCATCLPTFRPPAIPASRLRRKWHLVRCLARQFFHATPSSSAPPYLVIPDVQADWWSLSRIDVIAIENEYSEQLQVVRRSRELFRQTMWRGLTSAFRLYRNHDRVNHAWRASFGRLTSEAFWHQYLNPDRDASTDASGDTRPAVFDRKRATTPHSKKRPVSGNKTVWTETR